MSVSSDTQSVSQSPSPSPGTPTGITHAPKYGTVIPNRIFVGGIAPNTTEQELRHYFSAFGAVKDTKIIADRAGVSKGYGFVTFETQEDAEKIIKTEQSDNLVFKDRKLNIGPAIRKQQAFPRLYESTIPQAGTIMFQNGIPFTYQNGMAVFPTTEGAAVPAQPQQYLMTHQPQLYQPGHLQYYQPPVSAQHQWTTAAAPWRWAPQASPGTASPYGLYPTAQLQQLQGLQAPGELMYAQPPQYQPADVTEAAMMEAAPAEYSTYGTSYPPYHVCH
ncbi:protein boule-like [Lingula anatina]|uniref:Protein boule-like n=1 Tax=Lingula anatina TaxID=7574 RepID=A0A1S3K8C3_LINAN|nr:protein boule-like [Lingula anatina]|eukprot:XP_013418885.1 protein boule-like [Lingula anatina]